MSQPGNVMGICMEISAVWALCSVLLETQQIKLTKDVTFFAIMVPA